MYINPEEGNGGAVTVFCYVTPCGLVMTYFSESSVCPGLTQQSRFPTFYLKTATNSASETHLSTEKIQWKIIYRVFFLSLTGEWQLSQCVSAAAGHERHPVTWCHCDQGDVIVIP